MFLKKQDNAIGINISDLSVRFVLLEKKSNKIKIKSFGKKNLEPGIVKNGQILNKEKFKESISSILLKPQFGSVNTSTAILSLPETKTFIKLLYINKSPNKIQDLIKNEIQKEIPIDLQNYYYDFQIIDENKNFYKILIGVAPKNIVDQYLEVFQSLKLSVVAMEIESLSICRAVLKEESPDFEKKLNKTKIVKNQNKKEIPKTYGIIDIGATRSNMTIYSRNSIVLSISIPISGEFITNEISKSLDLKKDQAEKAKIVCGLDKKKAQGVIAEILSSSIKKLLHKINKVIEYYENEHPELDAIEEIIITGGGSNIKDLNLLIEKETKIPCKIANPLININATDKNTEEALSETHKINTKFLKHKKEKIISLKQNNIQEYTIAIGLSLRKIFLCKT